mmetsp:Transcript_5468/g.8511  ORF Transcript_5468/g.8511 Transcript_5468/m.8511 type:complete len:116 (+) Transcript_5468:5900-6247(+)
MIQNSDPTAGGVRLPKPLTKKYLSSHRQPDFSLKRQKLSKQSMNSNMEVPTKPKKHVHHSGRVGIPQKIFDAEAPTGQQEKKSVGPTKAVVLTKKGSQESIHDEVYSDIARGVDE